MDFVVLPAAGLAGLLGLLIGSFLNVVIYRLPKMMERQWAAEITAYQAERENTPSKIEEPPPAEAPFNLMVPRSACPACGHQVALNGKGT